MSNPERHMVIFKEPDGLMGAIYWIIRGSTITINIRCGYPQDVLMAAPDVDPLYKKLLDKTGLFTSNIIKTIVLKEPRAGIKIRNTRMVSFRFPDVGNLKLFSKGMLKSTDAYHIR